jgi:hypothetical protein
MVKSTSTLLDAAHKTSAYFNVKKETEIVLAAYSINGDETTNI